MKINFFGAAQTVTGSAHYLEVNGRKILLDCGLYQGKRSLAAQYNTEFRFPPKDIDAVILSHAHIDHSGNLPNLVKHGYDGPIYALSATVHLCELMLMDSARIQESDVRYINKRRAKRGEAPIDPLYTEEDAKAANQLFVMRPINKPFEVAPGVQCTLVEAGHILGSTAIVLDIEETGKKPQRLWFSGDIGRPNLPILRDPEMPEKADYLIMESTYGDKPHKSPLQAQEKLRDVIKMTLDRNGKVIIPAFAVGRTQELVYAIHKLMDSADIPKVPVYVDSPLAVNVTDVFRAHPECFDEEALAMINHDEHRAALGFDTLTYIRSVEESKALNDRDDAMIIISASGMMETGRVLHHLRHNIDDPRNTLLIVSWMAPHTLGRRLLEGETRVKIYGEKYTSKIDVQRINGFSAHAGQNLLREYANSVKDTVKDVFLVHGEDRGALPLMELLKQDGLDNVHYPERGWSFDTDLDG